MISIITICYNNVNGLKKTLESVIIQSYTDFEHIIVDGASTDGSIQIIKEYSKNRIGHVLWCSEPDSGIYNAMNKGIKMASGDYCLFLNSGDYFESYDSLEKFIYSIDGSFGLVVGQVMDETTKKIISFPPGNVFRRLLHHNFHHQALLIKRKLFDVIGFYSEDLRILADYEFNLKAVLKGVKVRKVNVLLSVVESGGISNTCISQLEKEFEIVQNRVLSRGFLFLLSCRRKIRSWYV